MKIPLPPLPPDFGDPLATSRPGGRSVAEVLAEEHRQIAGLAARLTAAGPEQRGALRDVLAATVSRHLSGEEQYLYPAVRAAAPAAAARADAEVRADRELLLALRELSTADPAGPEFPTYVATVADLCRRHAEAAERELVPPLCAAATEEELVRLGNRVLVAEEAAPTRPHPATPATPPWNKVVDPAVGVLDKVRDALTGRPTYPDEL